LPERVSRGAPSVCACFAAGLGTLPHPYRSGPARSAFCALSSLLPGTLPIGPDEGDALLMRCLDVGQPVPARMAAEARFLGVLGGAPGDG
jgi:multicomponent Na+:H+ antiporter subunit E